MKMKENVRYNVFLPTSAQNMAVEVLRSGSLIEGVLMCHVKSRYN